MTRYLLNLATFLVICSSCFTTAFGNENVLAPEYPSKDIQDIIKYYKSANQTQIVKVSPESIDKVVDKVTLSCRHLEMRMNELDYTHDHIIKAYKASPRGRMGRNRYLYRDLRYELFHQQSLNLGVDLEVDLYKVNMIWDLSHLGISQEELSQSPRVIRKDGVIEIAIGQEFEFIEGEYSSFKEGQKISAKTYLNQHDLCLPQGLEIDIFLGCDLTNVPFNPYSCQKVIRLTSNFSRLKYRLENPRKVFRKRKFVGEI